MSSSAAAGALGAIVSVLTRMSRPGRFALDHELSRGDVTFFGAYRPLLGAVSGLSFTSSSRPRSSRSAKPADEPVLRLRGVPRRLQRALGDDVLTGAIAPSRMTSRNRSRRRAEARKRRRPGLGRRRRSARRSTRSSPTRRVTPSASKRSSRSCAARRPRPSRSRKRASVIRPARSHSSTRATARARRPPPRRRAVAEADEPALSSRKRGELGVVDLHRLPARLGSSDSSAAASAPRAAELGRSPREVELRRRAARARRQRHDAAAHGAAGASRPGRAGRPRALPRRARHAAPRASRRRDELTTAPSTSGRARAGAVVLAASSPLEARRVGVPRRRGSRTAPPPTVVSAAEHDAVAARGDDGRREPELRVPLARADDAGRDAGGAVVDVEARAVRDRLELLERDVEPVARRGRRRAATSASPRGELARARRPASATATRWPALGALDRRGRAPARCARGRRGRAGSARSASPAPIDPDQSVPVATVPIPRSVNDAVDVEPRAAVVRRACSTRGARARARRAARRARRRSSR